MSKPTPEELETALVEAALMRELAVDYDFMAKSLLSLNYRNKLLEDVFQKSKLYLRSGMSSTEHTLLVRAIEAVEESDRRPGEEKPDFIGL